MMGTKALKQYLKQTGGVFVLTALALPFFLACVGLAVDVGNLYIHKSRLQNAADAAALAGGREFANQGETVASHPNADTEAQSYTNLDMATLGGGALTDQRYKAQQVDDDTILYGVRLTETVPLYFMRIFGMTDTPVVADAAVAIGMLSSGGGNGRDLIIFRNRFSAVNTIINPDDGAFYQGNGGVISSTFDGTIAYTDGSGKNPDNQDGFKYDKLEFSTQREELKYYFTEKARKEGVSVVNSIQKGSDYAFKEIFEDYDMKELGELTRQRLGLGEDPGALDWTDYLPLWSMTWGSPEYKKLEAELKAREQAYNAYVAHFKEQKTNYSRDLSSDVAIKCSDGNLEININEAIPGGADAEPVYVYIDKNVRNLVKLNLSADNERPLIIVYEGSARFQVEMNEHTFRGVLYAPNVDLREGLHINAENATFSGTIIADYINLRGDYATFKYENFGLNGGSGGSGGTKIVSSSSAVRLALTNEMDWT